MAINRFTRITPIEHTGQFFQLPFEAMQKELISKQTAYDASQTAMDEYLAEAAKQQYLPQDQEEASRRREVLMAQEKSLRERVGGDLASSSYQDGLRDLLRKDVLDPFYKNAAFMYDQAVNKYQPSIQEYNTKNLVSPQPWQDPFGEKLRNYRGAHQDAPFMFSGIDADLPFQPFVIETYVKPWLDKEFTNGKLKSDVINGIPIIKHIEKGEITAATLRGFLQEAGIEGQAVYNQLKRKYDNTPEAKQRYPTFEEYYNAELDNIARSMAISFSNEKIAWEPPATGSTSGASSNIFSSSSEQEEEEINTKIRSGVALENIPGASSAYGFPTRDLMVQRRGLSQRMLREFMSGGHQNAQGQTVPSVESRIQTAMGITQEDIDSGNAALKILPNGDNNELSINFTYKSVDGYQRTVDLINPAEAIIRSEEMPEHIRAKLFDALQYVQGQNTEYTRLQAEVSQLNQFDREMMTRYWGAGAFDKVYNYNPEKGQRGWQSLMPSREYKQDSNYDMELERKVRVFLESPADPQFFTTGELAFSGLRGETKRNQMVWFLENILGQKVPDHLKQDGPPITQQNIELHSLLIDRTKNLRMLNDDSTVAARQKIYDRVESNLTYQYLIDTNSPKMKNYRQAFTDHWEKGIDAQGNPLQGIASESGVRQTNRIIYDFNLANSTGSESSEQFRTAARRLIGSVLTANVTGGNRLTGQRGTNSFIPVYRWQSDEMASEDELKALGKVDEEGKFVGFDLVGFSTDDQGIVMVVQGKNVEGQKAGKNSWYEIRNQTQIFDMMSQAQFQSKAVLMTTHNMLNSFQDETETYTDGTQQPGQHRNQQTGIIDVGGYQRPVEKLMRNQMIDGHEYKEGTFRYYSVNRGEFVYTTDPLQVTMEAMLDRRATFEGPQAYTAFTKDSYTNLRVSEEVFKNGGNVVSTAIERVLNRVNETAPFKMAVTSAYRDPQHSLSRANPSSAHIKMDAVDFHVKDANGNIDDATVAYFHKMYEELRPLGYQIILEIPPSEAGKAKDYVARYGSDFVKTNIEHGTGSHIHIQFNRQLAAQAAAGN